MLSRVRAALPLAAVLIADLVPYAQTLSFGFTLDDANTIVGHRGVKEALAWGDLVQRDWWGRSRFDTIGTWRPMATLTFWCDEHLGHGAPWLFHATNLLLYAALLALADRFLARWSPALPPVGRWLALAVFGALAIHADVVPSPTGRAEILAALFALGAITAATCGRELGAREVGLACLLLFAALLSKESSAPMAVLVPLLAARTHAPRGTARRWSIGALAAGSIAVLALVAGYRATSMPFMHLGPERALENPLLAVDTPHRLLGALDVLALYLRHTATATRLAPDYSFCEPQILRDGSWWGVALGGAFVAASAIAVVTTWRRAPRVADATLGFWASYVSVSNVFLAASAIADRLLFFPSFWLIVAGALALEGAARSRRARRAVCAVAVAFVVIEGRAAQREASFWQDDLTLFGHAVATFPDVYRTQRNYAHALLDDGRHDDAAFHLTIAEAIHARYPIPTRRDAIAIAWDEEPLDARLGHLRDAFGAEATCAAAQTAADRIRSWGDPAAAGALRGWTRANGCAPLR